MGVYIKGVELPKDTERVIVIVDTKDGREACTFPKPKWDIINILEPHGRLIDENSLMKYFNVYKYEEWTSEEVSGLINNTPTVIEGSK